MSRKTQIIMLAIGAALVAGCVATPTEKVARRNINEGTINAKLALEQHERREQRTRDLVRIEDEYYVSPQSKLLSEPLPDVFERSVTLYQSQPVSVVRLAKWISRLSGYRVNVYPQVFTFLSEHASTFTAATGADGTAPSGGGEDVAKLQINYNGPISGLLDRFASAAAAHWEYDPVDQTIEVFRYKTRTFTIASIPGTTTGSSTIEGNNSGSSSEGSGGSTTNSVTTDYGFNAFESIQSAVAAMITENGKFYVAPDLTALTITDTPYVIDKVEDYMAYFNNEMTKEVTTDITILSVTLNDQSQYGINWSAIYQGPNALLSFNTIRNLTGFGQAVAGVVDPSSRFNNTKLLIDALSRQGDVSVVTRTTLRTLNNQVVPIRVGRRISYIGEVSTTLNSNTSQTSTEVEELNVGLTLKLTPHILPDSETVLMQLALSLSELLELETRNVGNGQIVQTPKVSTRATLERFQVDSGETLLISGFERSRDSTDHRSVLPMDWLPDFFVAGERSADTMREVLVILVQPHVEDGARAPGTVASAR